jgi:PTS system ascorbate-specific IIA component
MSIGILIIAHNEVGTDILSTARDIFGGLPVNAAVVSIKPSSDYDKKLVEARHCIAELDAGDGVLILTDIFGATPSNIALKAAKHTNSKVVAGVNLPMLVRVLNYSHLPLTKIVDKAVSAGHDSIFQCQ